MRPSINVVDERMIGRILDEAKRILSEIGVEVRGAQLRRRLLDSGLVMDAKSERILFPPDVVDQAIASTPPSFTLYDRDGSAHAEIGGDNVHFVPGSSGLKVLDHRSGETRLANTRDFAEYVRLADGLPHIAYLATAFSTNDDIEAQVSDAWRLYLCLTHSLKPVVSGAFTEHGVPRMAEMMQLFQFCASGGIGLTLGARHAGHCGLDARYGVTCPFNASIQRRGGRIIALGDTCCTAVGDLALTNNLQIALHFVEGVFELVEALLEDDPNEPRTIL